MNTTVLVLMLLLSGVIPARAVERFAPEGLARAVPVGAGSYWDGFPGVKRPTRDVRVGADWQGPLPSNTWYTSLLTGKGEGPLHVQPHTVRAGKSGLEVGVPEKVIRRQENGEVEISRPHTADFILEPTEFAPKEPRLCRRGDWTVTFTLARRAAAVDVTLATGAPFVWLQPRQTDLSINFLENTVEITGRSADGSALAFKVNNHTYGLFSPPGTTYSDLQLKRLRRETEEKNVPLVVACLPDPSPETFALFAKLAPARPAGSLVHWSYDARASQIHTTYRLMTEPLWGDETESLLGLFPHHWRRLNASDSLSKLEFSTIRGPLRMLIGTEFHTTLPFGGILPWLGEAPAEHRQRLALLLKEFCDTGQKWPVPFIRRGLDGDTGYDVYWVGKNLERLASAIPIAAQLGDIQSRDLLLKALESQLAWWFRTDKCDALGQPVADNFFHHDKLWGTLLAVGASHGSDDALNDHHLQYGYWIHAAAVAALFDPAWARNEKWGGMVELLISDIACAKRDDAMFPYLRHFSPYEGHSWASGIKESPLGPDQESSSEAINAWAGILLWGQATGNPDITALGAYLYATEADAIAEYWFDTHGDVFDREYNESYASLVWAGSYAHRTWWTSDPNSVHGINILPVTGASFYLAQNPDLVSRLYGKMRTEWSAYRQFQQAHQVPGNDHPDHWYDVLASYLALSDPAQALAYWETCVARVSDDHMEFGESKVHTFHWLTNLKQLGRFNRSVTADVPLFGVFDNAGVRTYLTFNPGPDERTTHFSDGTIIRVPPAQLVQQQR